MRCSMETAKGAPSLSVKAPGAVSLWYQSQVRNSCPRMLSVDSPEMGIFIIEVSLLGKRRELGCFKMIQTDEVFLVQHGGRQVIRRQLFQMQLKGFQEFLHEEVDHLVLG